MTPDELEKLLQEWILQRFPLTEAGEEHFPSFDRIFRKELDQIRKDFRIEPLTDFVTLVDDESPEFGTCRTGVERSTDETFGYYLAAIDRKHGMQYAEAFADARSNCYEHDGRASQQAYYTMAKGFPDSEGNPAYDDVRDTCLRLGHPVEYANLCAEWLLDCDFVLSRAHEITISQLKALKEAVERWYSPLRARMYADALGPKYMFMEEPLAELFSRIVEQEVAAGRTELAAEKYAEYYADCFGSNGICDLDDEEMFADYATVKAEAKCRHRYQDGEQQSFVDLFELLNQGVPDDPAQDRVARFDEVEKILRQDWFLADPEPPSTVRRWRKHKPHQGNSES